MIAYIYCSRGRVSASHNDTEDVQISNSGRGSAS